MKATATARNTKTKDTFEGGFKFISTIVGCDKRTLQRWYYEKGREVEVFNDYEIVFRPVIREKLE
jgi:hypothetical protein